MWCRNCHHETVKDKCELCGAKTEREIPLEVYWCPSCKVPVVKYANSIDHNVCSTCGCDTEYMCADLRPVFPEERLLFEIIYGKPLAYLEQSVWASDNRYYVDGKPTAINLSSYKACSPDVIRDQLEKYMPYNNYEGFDAMIGLFVKANEASAGWRK